MQSETFLDSAASVAAVAAVVGLLYARASAHAAREAADTARRSLELTERSRQAAARARLRMRVERVGELVQEMAVSTVADPAAEELSPTARAQCRVLHRAVIGLNDMLPKSVDLSRARSATELSDRLAGASAEIDGLLKKLTRHRPQSAYRPRHQVPWNRSSGVRSGVASAAGSRQGHSVRRRRDDTASHRRPHRVGANPPPPSTEPRSGDTSQ